MLEIGRAIGGNGVASGMGFVEGIGGEVHHLVEDMVRHPLADASFHGALHTLGAVDEILPLPGHHVVLLLTHSPADDIRPPQGVASQGADDLHDLLLIDHTSVGGGEDRLQPRILIVDGVRIMLALDITGDALHGARTIEGDASDDILEAVRLELHQKLPHARRFQLEHPVRVPSGDHGVHFFIGEIVGGEIRGLLPLLSDEVEGVPDDGEGPEAQKVHFQEAQLLQSGHGELGGEDPVVALQGHHRFKGHAGDYHARRMGRGMARQPLQLHGKIQHLLRGGIGIVERLQLRLHLHGVLQGDLQHVGHQLSQLVCLGVGHPEHPAHIPDDGLGRHGAESDDLGHVPLAVLLPYVVDDLLPPLVAEVHVEIRHGYPLRVQKPLEQQSVFQGIHVRDAHAVGGQAGGAAAPARAHHDVVGFGEMDKIPDDEIVIHKAHVLHHGQLVVQPIPGLLARVGHLFSHALLAKLSKIGPVVHTAGRRILGEPTLAELDLHVALVGHLHGVLQGTLLPRKEKQHLLSGLAVELLRAHVHPILLVHIPLGLDAQQHVLGLSVLLVRIMDIVGDHGLDAQFVGQPFQLGQDVHLLPNPVVLKLDIEILSKHALQTPGQLIGFLIPIMQQMLWDVPCKACRQADEPLVMLLQQIIVDARLIVEPVNEGLRGELHQILIPGLILGQQDEVGVVPIRLPLLDGIGPMGNVGLHAQDGLDPLLLALPIEIDDAVHDPMVRDGKGRLAQSLCPGDQSWDAGRPIQQGILGMDMQMHEGNRHSKPPQVI